MKWLLLALSLLYFIVTGDERTAASLVEEFNQVLGTQRELESHQVIKVIDGDTIELANGQVVRYIGIDTPETVHPTQPQQCFGQEAKAYNEQLVLDKVVTLEKDVSETDRYGRLLRYVYVGDQMVNQILVREGFAQAISYPPDLRYQQSFQQLQRQAREQNKGLWSTCGK